MLYRIAIMIDSLLGIFHISHLFRQHQGFLFHGLDLGWSSTFLTLILYILLDFYLFNAFAGFQQSSYEEQSQMLSYSRSMLRLDVSCFVLHLII